MAPHIVKALNSQIADLEKQLTALRKAREVLSDTARTARKRRKLTAKEKAAISKRMKAAWAKRKAAKKG